MKNLFSTLILAGTFIFNSYSQKIEKTENGFKQYNNKNQLIMELSRVNDKEVIYKYKYKKNGDLEKDVYMDLNEDGKIDLKKEYSGYIIHLKINDPSKNK